MNMRTIQHPLRFALLAVLAAGAPAWAQSAEGVGLRASTTETARGARDEARTAEEAARAAREAAELAEAQRRAGALTEHGQAQAEYSAWQADQASRRAERAAQQAGRAGNDAGASVAAAHGGAAQPMQVAGQSRTAATAATAASIAARDAAMEAEAAAATAQAAATAPPAPPAPTLPVQTRPSEPQVTITSSPPDSVVGEYRVDMARLDTDGDGRLTRSEASPNATLSNEFRAVDANGDGVLDATELKGWLR